MAQNKSAQDKPVWRILSRVGHRFLEQPPEKLPPKPGYFFANVLPSKLFREIVKTPPGSGKSRDATEFVNEAWENWGRKGLYLMLSHEAINQRLEQIKTDGRAEQWTHWRGHEAACLRRGFNNAGYSGVGDCGCEMGVRTAEGPTLAPLEYALPGLPGLNRPLIEVVENFDFLIFDEMDFRRLLGFMSVQSGDVAVVADTHPEPSVKTLSKVIAELMAQPTSTLSGRALYDAIDVALKGQGKNLRELTSQLREVELPSAPWLEGTTLPINFPPVLVPVLVEEADDWHWGKQFNPRIHISQPAGGTRLRIWWRKELNMFSDDFLIPPFFIMDATADSDLLGNVFDYPSTEELPAPEWPTDVHVHQWADDLVSRQTLGIRGDKGNFSPRSLKDRKRWYDRINEQLTEFPHEWPIGIITHQAIHEEAKRAIESCGFTDVQSLYYGDDRGSNLMKDVRVLVLLGLTIPNDDEFIEEAQAFLHDDGDLDFEWEKIEQPLDMVDGSQVMVTVGGHWKEPVASYYRQKCQFGLYQSINRIRPYEERDFDRHVFVFTNMPIPGVKVEHIMSSQRGQKSTGRRKTASEVIGQRLKAYAACTVTELADVLASNGGKLRTQMTWINRNAGRLAELTGSEFEPGNGSSPGRFVIHRD